MIIDKNDYEKDGIIHCGRCHAPKQHLVKLSGEMTLVRCICKCEEEQIKAERIAEAEREREMRIKATRKMGFPDPEMVNWTFDKDDGANERISRIGRKYVENFDKLKRGLLFYGSVGTGKTFISVCIANELINRGYPVMVTNFARLTNTIQGMFTGRQEFLDGLDYYKLLVIDDLASERDTEYMGEIVQNIIDSRYRARLPLIVTTNLTADELKNPADIRKERIYSRLWEMCIPVEVTGNDRRKEKLKAEFQEMEGMLGLSD